MVKVMSLLAKAGSGLRFSFGVRAWTEMEIRCVKGMYRLKLVSSENNSAFKGFHLFLSYSWFTSTVDCKSMTAYHNLKAGRTKDTQSSMYACKLLGICITTSSVVFASACKSCTFTVIDIAPTLE